MPLNQLLQLLNETPSNVEFEQVIEVITELYTYTPTQFSNGVGPTAVINEAGANEGSCKIFAFAQLHGLNERQTLNCFGKYYREDVLKHPDATDHGNIRNFITSGWPGIQFDAPSLKAK